jgi:hypothetical protein
MAKLPYNMNATAPIVSGGQIMTTVTVTDATGRVVLNRTMAFSPDVELQNLLADVRAIVDAAIFGDLTLADLTGVTLSWQIGLDTSLRNLDLL